MRPSASESRELSALRLQVHALVEQRRADKANERDSKRDSERAAMAEKIKELERQRAIDLLTTKIQREFDRRDVNERELRQQPLPRNDATPAW